MQKVKGQIHTRPETGLEPWRPGGDIILDVLGSSFSELVDSGDRLRGLTEASFWTSLGLVSLSWWIVVTDSEAWWRHHSGPPWVQ